MQTIKNILFILLFLCSVTTYAQHFQGKQIEVPPEYRLALDTMVSQYELYQLDRSEMNAYVKKQKSSFDLNLSLGEHKWTFQLEPKSVIGEGVMIEVMAGETSRFLKNKIVNNYVGFQERPENKSRFFISNNILNATIHEGNQKKRLYPLKDFVEEEVPDDWYVLIPYRSAQRDEESEFNGVLAGGCNSSTQCNVSRVFDGDELSFERFIEMVAIADHPFYNNWKGANCTGDECVENVVAKVSSIISLSSVIYEDYFDVELLVTYFRVFEEDDPYNTNHDNTLSLMRARWGANWGIANECIFRDVVHLFTAKNMAVNGAEYSSSEQFETCLHPYESYSFTRCTNPELYWYKTLAHELAHGLGAGHIDNTCPDNCDNGNTRSLMCTYGGGPDVDEITRLNQCNMLVRFLNLDCFLEYRPFNEASCNRCFVEMETEMNPSSLLPDCNGDNEMEITVRVLNNCIEKTMKRVSFLFYKHEFELLDPGDLGDFTSIDMNYTSSQAQVSREQDFDMTSEEIREFKINLRVKEPDPQTPDYHLYISSFVGFSNDQSPHDYTGRTSNASTFVGYDIELNGENAVSDLIADGTLDPLTNACIDMEPKRIKINGALIVDVDYCFYNSTIVMGAGAEITVYAGDQLSLVGTQVSGCNNMWKGIEVVIGGEINLSRATIKDAEKAITSNTVSHIESRNSIFENNHIGLYIPESFNGNARNVHVGSFYGNIFDRAGSFLAPYPGQSSQTRTPYAGIVAHDVNELNVKGVLTPHQLYPNIFQHIQNGIITYNTNLNISIAEFRNMNWFTSTGGSEAVYSEGDGDDWLRIEPSPFGNPYTNFESCRTGIQAVGMNLDIFGTTMERVYIGIDIDLSPNREIHVYENEINASNTGIDIYQCAPVSGMVENNMIYMSQSSYGTGIRINENSQSISGWSIQTNFIQLENGRYGIYHRGGTSSAISNNSISIDGLNIPFYNGIELTGSPRCVINCNEVDGNGKNTTTKYRGTGIFIKNSRETIVTCNYVNRSNIGIKYWLNCIHNEFSGNVMREHQIGFLLGHIYSSGSTNGSVNFSDQIHAGNRWPLLNGGEINDDWDCIGARNLGNANSPWYPGGLVVDASENMQFFPSFESQMDGWIQNIPDEAPTFQCEAACPNGIGMYFTDDNSDSREQDLNPLQVENNQVIRTIIGNTIAKESIDFSKDEIEELRAIAIQCPITGGNAVFEARSILTSVESVDYDDVVICDGQEETTETAVKLIEQDNIIQVFPNPAKDLITIHFPTIEKEGTNLLLVNPLGQVKASVVVEGGSSTKEIDVSSFTSGVYLLILSVNNEHLDTEEVIILK